MSDAWPPLGSMLKSSNALGGPTSAQATFDGDPVAVRVHIASIPANGHRLWRSVPRCLIIALSARNPPPGGTVARNLRLAEISATLVGCVPLVPCSRGPAVGPGAAVTVIPPRVR